MNDDPYNIKIDKDNLKTCHSPERIKYSSENWCKQYIGKFKLPPPRVNTQNIRYLKKTCKAIVFDLDETLGSFGDLYVLWKGIQNVFPEFNAFDDLLNLYPEFIRYGMFQILNYIQDKKKMIKCLKLYIYTNNQCSKEWVLNISNYFKKKLKIAQEEELFDKIIYAFKINKEVVEINRTTTSKTYSDLIRCAVLSKNTEICFIDDTKYNKMIHDKVYFIQPKPYVHHVGLNEIIRRCIDFWNIIKNTQSILVSETYWQEWFCSHNRFHYIRFEKDSEKIDQEVSRKIMCSIREFILMTTFYNKKFSRKKNSGIHSKNQTQKFY